MKRITSNTLNITNKRSIALYTQKFIENNFEQPITDSTMILHNNVSYFNDITLGETILKQTLVKGTFPRLSFPRHLIEKEMKPFISERIKVAELMQKSDFRLIGEILAANELSKTTTIIKQITMNYENPQKIKVITNQGNVNKDVTLDLQIGDHIFSLERDIKAGNNANNPFSGVIASIPFTPQMENYSVINNKLIALPRIQEIRLEEVRKLNSQSDLLKETLKQLEYINKLPLDIIQKNILIQEELFKAISLGAKIGSPSFYVAHIVPYATMLHEKFFEKLQPDITRNIFENKLAVTNFMKKALIIYNENISEISKNAKVNRKLLQESGLSEITDGIFT